MKIVDATLNDVRRLSAVLRTADREEIKAATGETPVVALARAFNDSIICKVGIDSDGAFGVFGVVPYRANQSIGIPWLVGSDRMVRHAKWFMRQAYEWKKEFHSRFPILWNYADARNTVHLKWIEHLGFTFIQDRYINNYLFREFMSECVPPPR